MSATELSLLAKSSGIARPGVIHVTNAGVTLPDVPCVAVKLENWDFAGDLVTPNNVDALWGYGGIYVHWLRVGVATGLLPVNNLKDICLRSVQDGQELDVFYSYYI